MKVIFLKDVPGSGKKFDKKEVSDGHALNYLIPNGLAETATAKAVKRSETEKAKADGERKVKEDLLLKNLGDIDGKTIEIARKANEKGHLFANIHEGDIAEAIKKQTRLDIDPHHIALKGHLKEIGEHEIEVKVHDKSVKFTVSVKPLE